MRRTALPPLNALRAFDAAARHLSFSKAANELNVTPAALSHQIRGLEEFLDLKLFDRMTRQVALTDAGELIQPDIRDAFVSLRRAIRRLERQRDDKTIVVSAGPAFTAKWLAPRLNRFAFAHPDIDLRISANAAREDFERDNIDASIRFGTEAPPELFMEFLLSESVTPMCSPSLLEGDGAVHTPQDLSRAVLIHDDSLSAIGPHTPVWKDWLEAAGVRGVDAERGLRFNLADHAIDAAVAGSGFVLAHRVIAQRDLALGNLVAPFELELPVRESFRFACLKGRENERTILLFREWLAEEIAAE